MHADCELAGRTRIRAIRTAHNLLIVAEGELPTPGFRVAIEPDPRKIHPQQFDLLRCPLPGVFPQVLTPFRHAETVRFPPEAPTVTVHHADGADEVAISECGPELSAYVEAVRGAPDRRCPPGADEATGFSRRLSFDEAFADALAKLPSREPGADRLTRLQVLDVGALFGGLAGCHDLYVRVCRAHD